jgi:hypothetical protein
MEFQFFKVQKMVLQHNWRGKYTLYMLGVHYVAHETNMAV